MFIVNKMELNDVLSKYVKDDRPISANPYIFMKFRTEVEIGNESTLEGSYQSQKLSGRFLYFQITEKYQNSAVEFYRP